MKAIVITKNGDANVNQLHDVPMPKFGPDEALIKIKCAGLNFVDIYQRRGRYPIPLPYTPGSEAAGVVEKLGPGVTGLKIGDRVAYTGKLGSFAEYNVVEADRLIPLPSNISFEQGAAFPLQGMTAHYLVNDFYGVKPNDTVLVHAAAGGVGLLVVQMLKHKKARVLGTVSNDEKAKIAREAGVDEVIIYSRQDFAAEVRNLTEGKGVDYIVDGVGKSTFPKDLDAVRHRGHIALFGSASGAVESIPQAELQKKSLTIHSGMLADFISTREELLWRSQEVLNGIQSGWLKLSTSGVFPLQQASEAQRRLEERQTTGKVILRITEP